MNDRLEAITTRREWPQSEREGTCLETRCTLPGGTLGVDGLKAEAEASCLLLRKLRSAQGAWCRAAVCTLESCGGPGSKVGQRRLR